MPLHLPALSKRPDAIIVQIDVNYPGIEWRLDEAQLDWVLPQSRGQIGPSGDPGLGLAFGTRLG